MPTTLVRAAFRFGLFVLSVTAALGCRGKQQDKGAPPPPQVTVVRPVTYPVRDYAEYNGYLETTQAVEIRARVKGFLTRVHFIEGTEVEQNKLLYNIDDREYVTAVKKAEAELAKSKADISNWKAQINLAEAELARVMEAKKSGAGAQTDVDKAAATLDVNRAQLLAAEATKDSSAAAVESAKIQLEYTEIHAPIAGRISRTLVDQGNLVGHNEATLLTTIVRVDELFVYFDVPEPDLVAYQRARLQQVLPDPTSQQIPVEIGVATEFGFPHVGRIDFRENRVDTPTGTIRVRGRIPNPLQANQTRVLYPGLYARVRVLKADPTPRVVIPEDALQAAQEGRFVYVVRPDNTVEKRLVTVGATVWRTPPPDQAGDATGWAMVNPKPDAGAEKKAGPPRPTRLRVESVVAIESGLKPDDRVIVNGLQKARPEAPVAPEEWVLTPPPLSQPQPGNEPPGMEGEKP